MQLTTAAEISLYPLRDDAIEVIKWFIQQVDQQPGIERRTTATCTQLQGEHDALFALLARVTRDSHARFGRQVLVCKFITGGLNLDYSE